MYNYLLFGLVGLVIIGLFIMNIKTTSKKNDTHFIFYDQINSKVYEGLGIGSKMDFPTINLIPEYKINSGIYSCYTLYGNGILFIDENGGGELHILNKKIKCNLSELILYNVELHDFSHIKTGIIGMINKGLSV